MAPLVIFDCDGVLVDSELLEHGVDAELLGPLGYAASPQELLQRFVGIARTDMYEAVFAELGREMPRGLLDEREKRVWQRCHSDLRTVPGVEEALEALRRRPKCVASSSIPAKLQLKLESTGLARHFAPYVFSTALVARGKPAPDIYLHAAQAVGHAANDCIVVEDSPHGIAGAKAAGMRAIGFTGGSHATPSLAIELRLAGAVLVVDHMDDLPKAIESVVVEMPGAGYP
ncbi:HAD family hydrolase [Reyranella soli]|uniref:Hydrolase n=1 Tax=Reyranella soli TaxID=1230389 RepID=A0A512NS69_9HYPH|nr:HAD family phosphatase [Reyranella soli]GEP61787.1 hydrolase [Reyranella soli]